MLRSLPPLNASGHSPAMSLMVEHRAPSPLPPMPLGHDISRPSSTSTQSSSALAFQQSQAGVSLPGLSALAAVASAPNSHLRAPFPGVSHQHYQTTASPTPTSVSGQSNPPICQNCSTSTTPLWRRDELGSVLCNACGLFLKLHGRPRPISLKTDVIKSRNRVKSSQQQKKKPVYFGHGFPTAHSEGGSPPPGFRRISNRSSGSDRSHSPISRTTTPAMLGMPPHIFDHSGMEHAFGLPGRSPSLPALHFRQPSPNGYMDRHLQPPHPFDGLQMANTELKTKVSELEVINGLFNDRVRQLEHEHRLILQREEDYKRQIVQLQDEVAFFRRSSSGSKRSLDDDDSPFAKRSRISDVSTFSILSNPSQPLSTSIKS